MLLLLHLPLLPGNPDNNRKCSMSPRCLILVGGTVVEMGPVDRHIHPMPLPHQRKAAGCFTNTSQSGAQSQICVMRQLIECSTVRPTIRTWCKLSSGAQQCSKNYLVTTTVGPCCASDYKGVANPATQSNFTACDVSGTIETLVICHDRSSTCQQ